MSSNDPAGARSWLMLPGGAPANFIGPAMQTEADVVVVDLEDSVPDGGKPEARTSLRDWLDDGGRAWARIDALRTPHWAPAVAALRGAAGLDGIILAKTEDPEEVSGTVAAFGGLPVVALIESAAGLLRVEEIARVPGLVRIGFGTGDFRRDTGLGSTAALAPPRARIAVASAAAGLPGPIDGGTTGTDPDEVRAQAAIAREYGFTAKFALLEEQIGPLNAALSAP